MTQEVTEADLSYLRRCVELAAEAVAAGDFPFGSVLVGEDGTVLAEDRNREVTAGDPTRHPEFELARWAATNMIPRERAAPIWPAKIASGKFHGLMQAKTPRPCSDNSFDSPVGPSIGRPAPMSI